MTTTSSPATGRLRARTRFAEDPGNLLKALPCPTGVLSWVGKGDGIVGWGEAVRFDPAGEDRFDLADRWWRSVAANIEVHDEVGMPGTGPVAFVSMAFADDPGRSVMIVPRVVIGRRDGIAWVTEIDGDGGPAAESAQPVRLPSRIEYTDGELTVPVYREAVREAARRIRAGELNKVVLAHDLLAFADEPIDLRWLLTWLGTRYPSCWVYAVDGMVGATPELLLRRSGDMITSRILAGTTWPQDGVDADTLAAELFASPKNRKEHAYAVDSVTEPLRSLGAELSAPAQPEVLRLPNVMHLCTDVTATLRAGAHTSLLRLAEAVHPTAAVGGTPRAAAVQLISELEGMDRGRYGGPIGWVDRHGDGEVGLALRGAQINDRTVRLIAGCGIMADSDPRSEAHEAAAKMVPMRAALDGFAQVENSSSATLEIKFPGNYPASQ